jgi:hypothetical protein
VFLLHVGFDTSYFNNHLVILEASMKVPQQPSEMNISKFALPNRTHVSHVHVCTKLASLALVAALASFTMSTQASAQTMTKADYSAAKTRLSSGYKADKVICKQMAGNAQDICIEEAKAKEKIAKAELAFAYTAKTSDQVNISTVKADTSYAVAKEKCDDLSGIPKTTCRTDAKAIHTKTLADIKMGKQINAAKIDDAQTKIDADYKVATQNCAALTEPAKADCVSAAKMKFGK